MELLKNNKGITLIILVVTIIVLLILAGISISAITGGNNSMDKAKKAKDETAIKAEMEELQKIINQSAAKGIRHGNFSGSADSQTIRDALKKNKLIEENPDDVIIDGKNGWKVTGVKTGQKYKIRYNGEVTRIEELAPTKIYGKIADGVLYLRATEQTGYTEGTKWNDATITKVIIEEPIAPSTCREMFKDCTALEKIENIEYLHTENSNDMSLMFRGCNNLNNIDISNFDTSNVTTMAGMFSRCKKLEHLYFFSFDTSNVITMDSMFYNCENLEELNLSNFNTSNVTNMVDMFMNCSSLTNLNISNFNTSNVTTMHRTFCGCINLLNLNVTSFDTSNVTDMHGLFGKCSSLTNLNVSNFNTENVTSMESIFEGCNGLNSLDITNFNTSNVVNMQDMFRNCKNLKILDLSSFDTKKVDKFTRMFAECENLVTIYVSNDFVTSQASNIEYVFTNCYNLVGEEGTTFTKEYISKTYARIDGGPSNPGYFTLKQ